MATLTLCGMFHVPSQNITSSNIINLNTSLVEGKYNYHSSENFDAYLKELGVSWYLRDLAAIASPVVSISRLNNSPITGGFGDFYTMKRSQDNLNEAYLAQLLRFLDDDILKAHDYY